MIGSNILLRLSDLTVFVKSSVLVRKPKRIYAYICAMNNKDHSISLIRKAGRLLVACSLLTLLFHLSVQVDKVFNSKTNRIESQLVMKDEIEAETALSVEVLTFDETILKEMNFILFFGSIFNELDPFKQINALLYSVKSDILAPPPDFV